MISRRTYTPTMKLRRLLTNTLRATYEIRDEHRFQVTRAFAKDLAAELTATMFKQAMPVERVLERIESGNVSVLGVRVRVLEGAPWPYMAEIVRIPRGRHPPPYLRS